MRYKLPDGRVVTDRDRLLVDTGRSSGCREVAHGHDDTGIGISHDQPPIALIGRSGWTKSGLLMP